MFTRVEEWVEEQQGRLEERLEEASQEEEQEKVKERMGEIKGAAGFVDCHDSLFTSMDTSPGVAAALRSEVEELRKVEAEVEQLRKRRDEGKVNRVF